VINPSLSGVAQEERKELRTQPAFLFFIFKWDSPVKLLLFLPDAL
jgi:hypothetical protein